MIINSYHIIIHITHNGNTCRFKLRTQQYDSGIVNKEQSLWIALGYVKFCLGIKSNKKFSLKIYIGVSVEKVSYLDAQVIAILLDQKGLSMIRLAPLKPVLKFHPLSVCSVSGTLSSQALTSSRYSTPLVSYLSFPWNFFWLQSTLYIVAKLISLKPSSDLVNHNWKILNEFLGLKMAVLKCYWTLEATGELLNILMPKTYSNLIKSESHSSKLGWEWDPGISGFTTLQVIPMQSRLRREA